MKLQSNIRKYANKLLKNTFYPNAFPYKKTNFFEVGVMFYYMRLNITLIMKMRLLHGMFYRDFRTRY